MREYDIKKIIYCPVCGNKFHKAIYDFSFVHCNDGCRTVFHKETGEILGFNDDFSKAHQKKATPVENRVSLRAVFEKIVNIVNEGKRFVVTQDFGDNTLTIEIDGKHTHCGSPGGTFEQLIDSLDDTLNKQKGLSWH